MSSLHASFPWTQSPLIVNAPMGGIAGSRLAISVTRAGGFGLMGMDPSASKLESWLSEVETAFSQQPVTASPLPYLPVGVGFLVAFSNLDDIVRKLQARTGPPPVVIWLFAADEPATEVYAKWATTLRKLYSTRGQHVPQIWIQVGGSATAALELAMSDAGPDVIVMQGSDAGGHGEVRGASIVALIPQVQHLFSDRDRTSGRRMPHVLASGGIVNAQGVLAALSLGAEAVVMGTRFLACPETDVPHPAYLERVLAAKDGARDTIRAKVFDELSNPNPWPVAYDGRALVSKTWREFHEEGKSIETVRQGHAEAKKEKDGGYGIETDRAVVWAGAGVGLVNKVMSAGEIVNEVREGAKALLHTLTQTLVEK